MYNCTPTPQTNIQVHTRAPLQAHVLMLGCRLHENLFMPITFTSACEIRVFFRALFYILVCVPRHAHCPLLPPPRTNTCIETWRVHPVCLFIGVLVQPSRSIDSCWYSRSTCALEVAHNAILLLSYLPFSDTLFAPSPSPTSKFLQPNLRFFCYCSIPHIVLLCLAFPKPTKLKL